MRAPWYMRYPGLDHLDRRLRRFRRAYGFDLALAAGLVLLGLFVWFVHWGSTCKRTEVQTIPASTRCVETDLFTCLEWRSVPEHTAAVCAERNL